LRQALTAAAFSILITGLSGIAQAAENQPISTVESTTAAAQTAPASVSQALSAETSSPDVAAWTSHLVISTPTRHHGIIGRFAGGILARTSKIAQELARSALRLLGTPYAFGGDSASGYDCSAYVQHVFATIGISLPRTADAQYDAGRPAVGGPVAGDLVFFQTYTEGVSHVGIYLGNGEFVHASSSHGVMISHLSDSYWASRYLGAKRLIATR
jgi:cell wall-associated NlpC family hydrolase